MLDISFENTQAKIGFKAVKAKAKKDVQMVNILQSNINTIEWSFVTRLFAAQECKTLFRNLIDANKK